MKKPKKYYKIRYSGSIVIMSEYEVSTLRKLGGKFKIIRKANFEEKRNEK